MCIYQYGLILVSEIKSWISVYQISVETASIFKLYVFFYQTYLECAYLSPYVTACLTVITDPSREIQS